LLSKEATIMEMRRLEYFVAVADERSFTRAAAKLYVAQPGVSAQIRKLERSLGQPLLDRSGRTVRLTDFGAAVLPLARSALASAAEIEAVASDYTGAVRGHVAVGTVTSHPVDLAGLLGNFNRDHPDVTISLIEGATADLVAELLARRVDAAIVALTGDEPEELETRVVTDDALVAVGGGAATASGASLPMRALRDLTLIALPVGSGIRTILDRACTAAGFTPTVAFEASDPTLLVQLAANGLGTAIVPASLGAIHGLDAVPIVEPELRGRLAWAWTTGGPLSPAGRALIARIKADT
jgi:DNA-binding transcriptional LysR family regulator